jgi:hypothetical protein
MKLNAKTALAPRDELSSNRESPTGSDDHLFLTAQSTSHSSPGASVPGKIPPKNMLGSVGPTGTVGSSVVGTGGPTATPPSLVESLRCSS